MPEGHTLHRIARDLGAAFVGTTPEVTSPQGRFAAGAALLSGREVLDARANGKHLVVEHAGDDGPKTADTTTTPADRAAGNTASDAGGSEG
mgnify:CR=1 FL=1